MGDGARVASQPRSTTRAWGPALSLLLTLAAGAVLVASLGGGLDLRVYRLGGEIALMREGDLYAEILGPVHDPGLPFTYPPFAAMIFAPLALLPWQAAHWVVVLVSIAVLWLVVRDLLRRTVAAPAWHHPAMVAGCSIAVMLLGPFRDSLSLGQLNILLLGACYLAMMRFGTGFWAGFVIGLCGGVKLTPLALGLVPLARRSWCGVAGVAAGFATTIGVSLLWLPGETLRYFTSVLRDPARIGSLDYLDNVSVSGLVHRAAPGGGDAWWLGASVLIVALAATVIALAPARERITQLAAGALAMLLISPVSWSHHWVWLPLVIAATVRLGHGAVASGLLARALLRTLTALAAVMTALLAIGPRGIVRLLGADADTSPGEAWFGLPADLTVIAAALWIATAAALLATERRRGSDPARASTSTSEAGASIGA